MHSEGEVIVERRGAIGRNLDLVALFEPHPEFLWSEQLSEPVNSLVFLTQLGLHFLPLVTENMSVETHPKQALRNSGKNPNPWINSLLFDLGLVLL